MLATTATAAITAQATAVRTTIVRAINRTIVLKPRDTQLAIRLGQTITTEATTLHQLDRTTPLAIAEVAAGTSFEF